MVRQAASIDNVESLITISLEKVERKGRKGEAYFSVPQARGRRFFLLPRFIGEEHHHQKMTTNMASKMFSVPSLRPDIELRH